MAFQVLVRKADRVTQRVEFPFAFEDSRTHFGRIVKMGTGTRGIFLEGVRVGIDEDISRLAMDEPREHLRQMGIGLAKREVGLNLR